nr:MAG TPA: hypothetical protein [Caudoviricetes sp.]
MPNSAICIISSGFIFLSPLFQCCNTDKKSIIFYTHEQKENVKSSLLN